jgi:hypothetical protein
MAVHYTAVFAGGKAVGSVHDGVFRKSVVASKHQLRRPLGWALDMRSLADAERLGARRVELYDRDSGQVYAAPIALIRARGFELDRGFGQQIALALDLWRVERPGQARQLRLEL